MECPKCSRKVRIRKDGKIQSHNVPNTRWAHRGSRHKCPASDTAPNEWEN